MLPFATPGALYIIVYNIIYYNCIYHGQQLCAPPDGRSVGSSHRDWASRGLFTGVAMFPVLCVPTVY